MITSTFKYFYWKTVNTSIDQRIKKVDYFANLINPLNANAALI